MGCLGVYNRDAAVAYARQYALNYNSQYDDYASGGGDCMNFVSQCLYAGGIPMKDYGHLWYCNSNESSDSWRGVDSFLAFLRKSFGSPHLLIECHDTPVNLKKGDIVFTVADGAPGNIARNPSHIVILSEDYATYGKMIVCGHTTDQKDEEKTRNDRKCTYIHILTEGIQYDYIEPDYEDATDMSTAEADFGTTTLRPSSSSKTTVRNLQTRLNYLGFNCGSPDGIFGCNTTSAVRAFQTAYQPRFGLTVDGLVGQSTKEALRYPKAWLP